MVYDIHFDSFTKINEASGTVQNIGEYPIEMSETPTFNNGIVILPNQKNTFSGTDIYLRCTEEGFKSEVRVVPFIVDVKGGDSSSAIGSDSDAFKAVSFVDNTLNFFTSSDTDTAQAAASIDIPAEQFLDAASTSFVPNFIFSAILYEGAANPNLDGKPVLVLAIKSKNNDGILFDISYKFLDLSSLLDSYIASDTSVVISDYKVKVNISSDNGNFLRLKSNGLFADGMTDTATSTSNGLMSATDKVKLDGVDTDTYATKTDLTDYVQKDGNKGLSTNDFTTADKTKLDGVDTDSYVMKVSGKGLSTNDFTTAEKNKLTNIADSAQVNVIESVKVNNTALAISNKAVNIDLANSSVKSAASLNSAKSLKVNLASSNAQTFDGSDNATVIGVGGILPTTYGGTGNSNGTVSGAAQLNTSQNFITNLASTVAGSFNGTASVSSGVTGTLPVANGGTGQNNLNNVTVGGANRDGEGNVITVTYATMSDLYKISRAVRFGYRIKQSESNPSSRVEYLYDTVGMTPASMNFSSGVFNYGSWKDVWFVRDNKPCMLKSYGSVDYYLDPNDYTKKADGSASDVADTSYDGNAMAQFPLCWIKRYTEGDYLYEIVSNVQYDEDYHAYAHTDADGNIKNYFYRSLFAASNDSSKLRSIKGQTHYQFPSSVADLVNSAAANGDGWFIESWSQYNFFRTLLTLISKSTNSQTAFGCGFSKRIYNAAFPSCSLADLAPIGSLYNKGQFFGSDKMYAPNTIQVKAFHIEDIWANQQRIIAGLLASNGSAFVKMTPEGDGYQFDNTDGYSPVSFAASSDTANTIKTASCSQLGFFPTSYQANNSLYYCDISGVSNVSLAVAAVPSVGIGNVPEFNGIFNCGLFDTQSFTQNPWSYSAALTYL